MFARFRRKRSAGYYTVLCPCGKPLHYRDSKTQLQVEDDIRDKGPYVEVTVLRLNKTWLVPRHYVALHGVESNAILRMARQLGWQEVETK